MDRLTFDSYYKLLHANGLFSNFSDQEYRDMARICHRKTYDANQTVIKQGEPGDEMYIIAKGKVSVKLQLANGEDIAIGELSSGESFGEIALFDQLPRTATIVSDTTCELLVLHREAFKAFLSNHPPVAIQLLSVMANRLRNTNDLLKDSIYSQVTARLANALCNIAKAYGKQTSKGLQIEEVFEDAELADIAGIPGDVVTAQLRHWRKEGVINLSHGYLTLVKPEALA